TCLPAVRAALACSACRAAGEAKAMASIEGSASKSPRSRPGTEKSRLRHDVIAWSVSETAANAPSSAKFRTIFFPQWPQPTTATLQTVRASDIIEAGFRLGLSATVAKN